MIYVTQEPPPGVNILGATEYGQLKMLSPLRASQFVSPVDIVENMRKNLRDFSDEDYILPMGDPAVIGIATTLAAHANEGRVKFLKWDRQERMYYVWSVDMKGKR